MGVYIYRITSKNRSVKVIGNQQNTKAIIHSLAFDGRDSMNTPSPLEEALHARLENIWHNKEPDFVTHRFEDGTEVYSGWGKGRTIYRDSRCDFLRFEGYLRNGPGKRLVFERWFTKDFAFQLPRGNYTSYSDAKLGQMLSKLTQAIQAVLPANILPREYASNVWRAGWCTTSIDSGFFRVAVRSEADYNMILPIIESIVLEWPND